MSGTTVGRLNWAYARRKLHIEERTLFIRACQPRRGQRPPAITDLEGSGGILRSLSE